MSEVILYDLPSKGHCASWSLNPWKTRLFLNVKGIPYETEWTEYPDLAPKFKSYGIPPKSGRWAYTSPTIRIGNQYVMDSENIAIELEKQYPSPPLHLDSPLWPKAQELINNCLWPLAGVLMPPVPKKLLNEASAAYWIPDREAMFGMSLDQYAKEKGGENAWESATPTIREIGALLKAEDGPFLLGRTVSYADLVVVAFLHFLKRVDENIYERVASIEPALKDLYEASKTWLERDN